MASSAHSQAAEDWRILGALPDRFSKAWAQHDAHGLAAIMSKDVDFVNVGAIWLHGPDFETYHDRILKGRFKSSTNKPLAVKVGFIRPDIAVVRWSWEIRGETLADGSPSPTRYGLMTFIVEKRDDAWLVTNAQNTNAGPARPEAADLALPMLVPRNP
jgi:uncharacterized protein (TIGR02246 family)